MEYLFEKLKDENFSRKTYVIGIDGLGGAGKSTIVNSLKLELNNKRHECYILHIDDFINKREIRYDDSKEQWYCYYNIQWRYDYLIKEILEPIKRGEEIKKGIELYDKENDEYTAKQIHIPKGEILILEGVFLQRKELKDYLDFTIYLDVEKEVRLKRVLKRDGYIGDAEEIKCKYEKRYFPAEDRYLMEYNPIGNADLVLKNR